MDPIMHPVHISQHPLVQHKIGLLRREETPTKDFRQLAKEIAMLLFYEAASELPLEPVSIQTPICGTTAQTLAGKAPVLVPILRAGLGMCDGILELIPHAHVGHIGLYRNEETLEPVEYYSKFPKDVAEREVFLLDPMLATGNSACDAVRILRRFGCQKINFICLVAARQGLEHMQQECPDVRIVAGAYDAGPLNEHGYIVPGLGDAGDRIFGTK